APQDILSFPTRRSSDLLMWRSTNADGTLTYSFVESLVATYPYYLGRLAGGVMILAGVCLMSWNLWRTRQSVQAPAEHPVLPPHRSEEHTSELQSRENLV